MKKILSIVLAAAMLLSLSVTAFASNVTVDKVNDQQQIDVTVNYKENTPDTVYSVTISWDDMTFELAAPGTKVWDTEAHKYIFVDENGDKLESQKPVLVGQSDRAITVSNHSNAAVNVSTTVNNVPEGWTVAITPELNANVNLPAAEEGGNGEQTASVFVALQDWPEEITEASTTVGTVTVTIAAAA